MDLNMSIINFFRKHLGISTPLLYSSDMAVEHLNSSDLILEICRQQLASIYLCGVSGKDYLNTDSFKCHNISIKWLDYKPLPYNQLSPCFVPYMSILDLLFNYGNDSLAILLHQK